MITLSHYDLISPSSYYIKDVGHIKPITLSEIDGLPNKYQTYYDYVRFINLSKEDFIQLLQLSEDVVSALEQDQLDRGLTLEKYDLLILNQDILNFIILSLNFFFDENVSYYRDKCLFIVHDGDLSAGDDLTGKIKGIITRDNYDDVTDVILQRCAVKTREDIEEEHPKFKNEKARKMWERQRAIKKKREEKANKEDAKFFDIANIISAVSSKHPSLNMINIWDITVYNLYEQFSFLRDGVNFETSMLHYAVWGAESNEKVDIDAWFKRKALVTSNKTDDFFNMAKHQK